MSGPTKRERLGRRVAFSHREYVYRTRDCFEIDEVEGYEVARKRVFYDDVLLVTRHTFVPWGQVLGIGLIVALLALFALAVGTASWVGGVVFFVSCVLPPALYAVLLLARGAEEVTIQGKRTLARMQFGLGRKRAEEVFRLAARLARERQERLVRDRSVREAPPPVGGAEPSSSPSSEPEGPR
jgi:hypothetical protein